MATSEALPILTWIKRENRLICYAEKGREGTATADEVCASNSILWHHQNKKINISEDSPKWPKQWTCLDKPFCLMTTFIFTMVLVSYEFFLWNCSLWKQTGAVNIGDTELGCMDAHTRISFHTSEIIIRPLKQDGKYGCEVDRRKTFVRS